MAYLAECPSQAMPETLTHFELDVDEVPDYYQLLALEYASRKGIWRLSMESLPEDWRQDQEFSRAIGDEWLYSIQGVLLRVLSTIVPHSYNYLFTPPPRHGLAKEANIVSCKDHPYDHRLTS